MAKELGAAPPPSTRLRHSPEVNRHIAEATALGRPGLPDDMGLMIAALLSKDNRSANAQRIEVSGGQSIWPLGDPAASAGCQQIGSIGLTTFT